MNMLSTVFRMAAVAALAAALADDGGLN